MSSKSRMKRGKGSGDSWIVLIDYTHKAVLQGLQQIGSFELYHQSTIAIFFLCLRSKNSSFILLLPVKRNLQCVSLSHCMITAAGPPESSQGS